MSAQSFEGLSKIGQINIPVHNLEAAIEFYRDTLGMRYLFRAKNMAFFDCEGIRLLIGIPENEDGDHPGSIIYFKVDDIHSATEILRGRGVEILSDPGLVAKMEDHDLWMSFFKDLDDNTLALMSEIATA